MERWDRSWLPLATGAFLVALAVAFGRLYDGWLLPPEAIEGRRWYFAVIGIALLVMGATQVLVGLAQLLGGPLGSDAEVLSRLWMATAILTMLAVMATYAALAAWIPGLPGTFEGGLTGTMVEHRIVWTIVAIVLDLLALPFLLLVPLGTIAWVVRAVRRRV